MKVTMRAARVNAGLTQEQVARALEVSRSTVGNWESGKTFPDAMQIRALESLYKLDFSDILLEKEVGKKGAHRGNPFA